MGSCQNSDSSSDGTKQSKKNGLVPENKKTIILLGSSFVGKTQMINCYGKKAFRPDHHATIKPLKATRNVTTKSCHTVNLTIWDTPGASHQKAMARMHVRTCHACIVVYDITDMTSFEEATEWVQDIRAQLPGRVVLYVIANKSDLKPNAQVPNIEGQRLAEQYGAKFFEVSASSGKNIAKAFEDIIESVKLIRDNSSPAD